MSCHVNLPCSHAWSRVFSMPQSLSSNTSERAWVIVRRLNKLYNVKLRKVDFFLIFLLHLLLCHMFVLRHSASYYSGPC